jgi:hypothetical protein
MTKLKTLTATLAATALVSGIGLAYAQSTDTSSAPQGQPAAADSQYNSSNSATNTAPADTSTTAPADTSSSTASTPSTDTSTSADTTTSADNSMSERAPQADRN